MSVNQTAISSVVAISPIVDRETRRTSAAAKRGAVCAGLLALLMVWAVVFPQTGDGDAIMHYLNAHDSLWQPAKLMGSWATGWVEDSSAGSGAVWGAGGAVGGGGCFDSVRVADDSAGG